MSFEKENLQGGEFEVSKYALEDYTAYMLQQKSINDAQNLFLTFCLDRAFEFKMGTVSNVNLYESFTAYFRGLVATNLEETYGTQSAVATTVNDIVTGLLEGMKQYIEKNLGYVNVYFKYNFIEDLTLKLPKDKKLTISEEPKEELFKLVLSVNSEGNLNAEILDEKEHESILTTFSYENGVLNVTLKDLFNLFFISNTSFSAYRQKEELGYGEECIPDLFADFLGLTSEYINIYNQNGTLVYFNELLRVSAKPNSLIYIIDKDLLTYIQKNIKEEYKAIINLMVSDSDDALQYSDYENNSNKNYTDVYYEMFTIPNASYQKDLGSMYDLCTYLMLVSSLQQSAFTIQDALDMSKTLSEDVEKLEENERALIEEQVNLLEADLEILQNYLDVYDDILEGSITFPNIYKQLKAEYISQIGSELGKETENEIVVEDLPDFDTMPELYVRPLKRSSDLIARPTELYILKYPLKDDAYTTALSAKYKNLREDILNEYISIV